MFFETTDTKASVRSTRLQRRVAELISEWDDEGFDDARDAGQEAQELLTALSKTAPERPEVERVLREVLAVLGGQSAATPKQKKAPRTQQPQATKGAAFMQAVMAGEPLGKHLAPTTDDFFVSQVTTVITALVNDDTGAWAKKQLRTWPRDVPFTKEHLARWNAPVLRSRIIAASAQVMALVSTLSGPSFQVREDAGRALCDLAVREGTTAVFSTVAMKRALASWTDQPALFRLTRDVHHRARSSKPPANARYQEAAEGLAAGLSPQWRRRLES